ncbi:hypothetical protein [Rhizobium sp. CSW-27]|uniref:hypothetical protein n=1 Tax=Rhizobium sp. CSW-27 TaxID=2839985 RepID=UPI001C00E141|nr:hypothetical protein [Rhizobium sp. CSW-27]MBT9369490.1 hypothetical protein [Rhizobium sp. CSW-27]
MRDIIIASDPIASFMLIDVEEAGSEILHHPATDAACLPCARRTGLPLLRSTCCQVVTQVSLHKVTGQENVIKTSGGRRMDQPQRAKPMLSFGRCNAKRAARRLSFQVVPVEKTGFTFPGQASAAARCRLSAMPQRFTSALHW